MSDAHASYLPFLGFQGGIYHRSVSYSPLVSYRSLVSSRGNVNASSSSSSPCCVPSAAASGSGLQGNGSASCSSGASASSGASPVALMAAASVKETPPAQTPPAAHSPASEEHPLMKATRHFVGGTLGGMCGVAVSYPFDTVKVRMQTGAFNSMVGAFTHVAKNEGVASFYRGVMAPLSAYGIIKAITFGTYGNCLDIFAGQKGTSMAEGYKPSYTEIALAGFAAGFTSTFVMAPSDSIKIAMQAGSIGGGTQYKNSWECAKHLIKERGVAELFRGTGATMARDAPSMGLYYIVYDVTKKVMPPAKADGRHAAWQMMFAGALAGASSWLPVYPFDVLKSRLQQPGNDYKGMVDCAVRTVKSDGPLALYKGLGPVLMGSMPLHGTVFMVYELFMDATGGH